MMAEAGVSKGKSGLVRQDASNMLMNCMIDSVVTKTVLFIGILYLWTEFIWVGVSSQDLIVSTEVLGYFDTLNFLLLQEAAALPDSNPAADMVGWSFAAFGVLILLFGAIASVHVMVSKCCCGQFCRNHRFSADAYRHGDTNSTSTHTETTSHVHCNWCGS